MRYASALDKDFEQHDTWEEARTRQDRTSLSYRRYRDRSVTLIRHEV